MLKGFKEFILRGNVVDLAVGIVIGAAFTAVVTQLTKSFLEPLIKVISGGGKVAGTIVVNEVIFDYGAFINAIITFILTAAALYFLVVLPVNKFNERRKRNVAAEEDAQISPAEEIVLLTEIRDALRTEKSLS